MLNIAAYGFQRCASCRDEAKGLGPEHFLPQLFLEFGMLFLDQTAAGGFIRVDKMRQFAFQFGPEQNMYVIDIMIPFFDLDLVFNSNLFEYFAKTSGNRIIDDTPSVLDHKDQVKMKSEYRMMIAVSFHFPVRLSIYAY